MSAGTLRAAIELANNNPQADTILFSADPADGLNGGTINLDFNLGELRVTDDVVIDASNLSSLTISARHGPDLVEATGDGFRVFKTGGAVTLKNLTITGGDVGTDVVDFVFSSRGGGILNVGDLLLDKTIVQHNAAYANHHGANFIGENPVQGGGVYSRGTSLTIQNDSIIENNTALYVSDAGEFEGIVEGGGVYATRDFLPNGIGQVVAIMNSTIRNNEATWDGPGILQNGADQQDPYFVGVGGGATSGSSAVPEPTSVTLLALLAACSLCAVRRRRKTSD